MNDHHQILSVTEYLKSSYAREVRFCDKNKEQILSLACSKCYLILCARCLKSGEGCLKVGQLYVVSNCVFLLPFLLVIKF